jgi:exodeoxyribonuclease V alpha subunit
VAGLIQSLHEQAAEAPIQDVVAGVVERVTFHNADAGFCVLRVKARGHRDLATVVGHAATISPGEWITAIGDWVNERTHGQQFKARFLRASAPSSAEGIERCLASGMIRDIGPVYASKMVKTFGEKVMAREIMVFLHSHGVGTARGVRIYKTYRADAIPVMTENHYRICPRHRLDRLQDRRRDRDPAWHTEDGGDSHSCRHLVCADEAMDEGHCGVPNGELVLLATELLDAPEAPVETALNLELSDGTVVADTVDGTACLFLGGLYRAEQVIAERLSGPLPWAYIDPEKALPWIERKTGLALADSQRKAISRSDGEWQVGPLAFNVQDSSVLFAPSNPWQHVTAIHARQSPLDASQRHVFDYPAP